LPDYPKIAARFLIS